MSLLYGIWIKSIYMIIFNNDNDMAKIEIYKVNKYGENWLVGIDSKTGKSVFRAKTEKIVKIRSRLNGYTEIENKY